MDIEKHNLEHQLPVYSTHPAGITTSTAPPQAKKSGLKSKLLLSLVLFGLLFINGPVLKDLFNTASASVSSNSGSVVTPNKNFCPVSPKVIPEQFDEIKGTIDEILHSESFRNDSALRLSQTVQIPTEVNDNTKYLDLSDPSFEPFIKLHKHFESVFPLVHKHLKKEEVNKHGLLFTWEGSEPQLKPLLLTAHQDVVPVDWSSEDRWTYYPFSGHYDGEKVWGRGASDCKNLLTGLLETVELLLRDNYKPKRTVILSFGFDEEASGVLGASKLGETLLERYGEDSIYALFDEGNAGLVQKDDRYFVEVPTGEKGYVDSHITLNTPGGHSSVPPDHTSIGILAELINLVEKTPFKPTLPDYNPFLGFLQCYATYSGEIDPSLKSNILNANEDDKANAAVIDLLTSERATRYLIGTSQATDIISGGVKANALPESAKVVINSRINVDSSVNATTNKVVGNVREVADKYDLGLIVLGETIKEPTANGYFNYTIATPLEVAPISPRSGPVWDLFSGSLRHLYEDLVYPNLIKNEVVTTPGLSTGNTDTRYYWKLTKNIYRTIPGIINPVGLQNGIHSVDEFVSVDAHLNIIAFYYEFIRNIDSYGSD